MDSTPGKKLKRRVSATLLRLGSTVDISDDNEIDPHDCSPGEVAGSPKTLFSRDDDELDVCDFDFIRVVGHGSYGEVELWEHIPRGKTYAAKSVNLKQLEDHEQAMVLQELRLLRSLFHPHLSVCWQAFGVDSVLILLLTYYRGGTLESKLKNEAVIQEDDIGRWLCQLLSVVRYLHAHNVIHRDICLENIFLTEDHLDIVLGDLGACRVVQSAGSVAKTPMGHLKYLSPEMLEGEDFTTKTDIWSLGIALQRLLRVDNAGRKATETSTLVGKLTEIMLLMLQEDVQMRPSAATLCSSSMLDGYWPPDLCRNESDVDAQLSDSLWRSALRLGAVKSLRM